VKNIKESDQLLIVLFALVLSIFYVGYTGNSSDVDGYLISVIIVFSVALVIQAIDRNVKELKDLANNIQNNLTKESK
jgi:hypothetical protein